MGILLILAVLAVLVVVAALVVGGVALAQRSKGDFQRANEVVPGRPTRAPASWAGSHDPEARLHRRLRDAVAALRSNSAFDSNTVLLNVRVDLEEQALNLDDQLVVVAGLPAAHRSQPLAEITGAVELIEKAVSDLASQSARELIPRLETVLTEISQRSSLVDAIRAELDDLPAVSPGTAASPAPKVVAPPVQLPTSGDPSAATMPASAPGMDLPEGGGTESTGPTGSTGTAGSTGTTGSAGSAF